MEFSKNWIGDFVDLPPDAVELADRLTSAGLAVEGVEARDDDHVLDIEVTTNRPDCMSHLGLAREVAALYGAELHPPATELETAEAEIGEVASLEIEDFDLCPRYTALVIQGVKVGPSPDWLRRRLEAIGARSINNVVDITNYVLWETGQPLHAFDLERIAGGHVRVRRAQDGETLKTLDGEDRELDPSILVIADAERPIALGGIMGGFDSEVTDDSTDVLLESAHFDPNTVRRGAKKLGMHTDASHRFERGADPEACLWASRRAAALIVQVAGGEVLAGELDSRRLRADWPPRVTIQVDRLERFGGIEIGGERSVRILESLGFSVDRKDADRDSASLDVTAPSWRYYDFDNAHAQDVYEEVLRIVGFDPIEPTLPAISGVDAPIRPSQIRRRRTQDVLAAAGLAEAINFAFHSRAEDDAYVSLYGDRPAMELANPLSDLYAVMRRSLLPNLVAAARYNQHRGAPAVGLFEIGHIFGAEGDAGSQEMENLAVVMGGEVGTPWERHTAVDFYDLKGVIELLGFELGRSLSFRAADRSKLVPGSAAEIRLAGTEGEGAVIGHLGQLDEDTAYPLLVAELSLDLLGDPELSLEVRTPSRYPGISVDLTFTHALSVPWREIEASIRAAEVEDLRRFALHDRYRGEGVPDGAVNTSITFHYNSEERSLTQEEV
ncbi:MAG: phenylalanine--tRNA ligase subunit beta, partial [Holophagales bacterium]|nr:phenylalanine--tRNA ligase subunit beta [Holophagales bacterium]